jgi:hypothetical protein
LIKRKIGKKKKRKQKRETYGRRKKWGEHIAEANDYVRVDGKG